MHNTSAPTGKAVSIFKGMMIAGTVSITTTIMLTATIANYLNKEKITWEEAGYWIMLMLFLSAFSGGKCAYATIKRQKIAVSLMSGFLYWGILLCCTALFFGGNYDALLETSGIIVAGCLTAALLFPSFPKNNRRNRKRSIVKFNKNAI